MKNLATFCLRIYKGVISPHLPVACRFVPSCSEYAAEAVAKHGLPYGSALGLWRILRCNPFARGGYDPVPAKKATKAVRSSGHTQGRRVSNVQESEQQFGAKATGLIEKRAWLELAEPPVIGARQTKFDGPAPELWSEATGKEEPIG